MNTVRRWQTWEQAADFTTLSKATLKRLARAGRLPVTRIGRRTMIRADHLDSLLNEHRVGDTDSNQGHQERLDTISAR